MENTLLSIKSIYIVLYIPSVELTFTYWILADIDKKQV